MQFKVPQFLDIEDKIFGPFTFRQFAYLAGGAGLCFTIYKLLGLVLGVIPIFIIGGFSLALAFYHPNNKPFIFMVESGFKYLVQSKLYIWKRKTSKIGNDKLRTTNENKETTVAESRDRLSGDKLKDLAWSLNVLDLSKQKEN